MILYKFLISARDITFIFATSKSVKLNLKFSEEKIFIKNFLESFIKKKNLQILFCPTELVSKQEKYLKLNFFASLKK